MADASVERPGSEGVPPAALRAHAMQAAEVLEALGSRPEGLSRVEVDRRLEQYGPNALEAARPTSAWKILVDQLRSLVVILLFAAAIVALFLGDPLDAAAIGGVLVINTALGFFSELRARRAMEALLRLEAPQALVIREDRVQQVQAREVVPGDVVVIEAGQSVPADCRILDSNELRTNEAALTGESLPVEKRSDPVHADSPLPDRTSMLYLGTTVVAGSGRAVVVATGMGTELGRIGGLVAGIPEERTRSW
jgi:Ca2+-transporting ATPase